MRPPLPYIGGKTSELKYIKRHEPKPNTYTKVYDLFGGGGSVSLMYLERGKKVAYNDITKWMVKLFRLLKKGGSEYKKLVSKLKRMDANIETFKKQKAKLEKNPNDLAARIYVRHFSMFNADGNFNKLQIGKKEGLLKRMETFDKFKEAFKSLTITNQNALTKLNKLKSDPNAYIYLDPPYMSTYTGSYDRKDESDIIKIADIIKSPSTKAKILINIESTKENRKLFKSPVTKVSSYRKAHVIAFTKKKKTPPTLVIKNY